MASLDQNVSLSGYLKKKSMGTFATWQKRWFQLRGNKLLYSHEPNEACTKVLLLTTLRLVDNPSKPFMFTLLNQDGTPQVHILCANEQEKVTWWAALQKAIKQPGGTAETGSSSPAHPISPPSANDSKVRKEDFQQLALIGRGSCGKVLKVRHKQSGAVYAMKVMYKEHVVSQHMAAAVMAESGILRTLQHPFVVKLHAAFQTDRKLYLIEDFHCGGALTYHLSECGWFSESRTQFYAAELCLAIRYLHSKNVIYRDIKPGNIILDRDGHVIITDFGLATIRNEAMTFCGTPHCMAPEVVMHLPYTNAVDWWSYGAVVFHMLMGCPPFTGESRQLAYDRIVNSALHFPRDVSKAAQNLLHGCLNKNPTQRLNGDQIMATQFFHGLDWGLAERRGMTPPINPNIKGDDLKYFPAAIKKSLTDGDSVDEGHTHQPENFEGFSFYGKT